MWHAEHTVQTTTEPGAIWRRWLDVAAWPEWDDGLLRAQIDGPLVAGSLCTLHFRKWGSQTLRIVDVHEGRGFTCVQHRFLADFRIHHRCEPSELGSRVTHRVEVEGLLAWWLHLKLGSCFRKTLPLALRKLARIAGA
jgi:hypothetical protein